MSQYEYERDAFDEAGDDGNGIVGEHLKCPKGTWMLGDKPISPGSKFCIIMESAIVGEVVWKDGKIVERDTGRRPPKHGEVAEGRNPYVSFQVVRADEDYLGELATFAGSSWGAHFAFQNLINPWRLKGRRQLPICALSTKDRGDENRNINPVFKIVGWSDRENFTELLPPPVAPSSAAIAYSPKPATAAEIVSDEIPF
jgi:hypothetical protein